MYNLVYNEWVKIFKQIGTIIMIGLVVLLIIAAGFITKYLDSTSTPVTDDWKQELTTANAKSKEIIDDSQIMNPGYREFLQRDIAINEYRITQDLRPDTENSMWTLVNDSADFISFAGLFVIIIAAGIVANEFSWGTIKILLVRPFKRSKILLSKYITVILFLLLTLAVLFISACGVGAIFFGMGDKLTNIHLAFVNGTVEEQNLFLHLIKLYGLKSLSVFLLATMAFMISAVFGASGLAIGLSIFLLLMGGQVTSLLASKFTWAKYSLFANTDLMQYYDGIPLVEGMTLQFSLMMILVYFVIFHLLAFIVFTKRDVAT